MRPHLLLLVFLCACLCACSRSERTGRDAAALCAGGIVLSGPTATRAQQVAEGEDQVYQTTTVMSAGSLRLNAGRRSYLSATLPSGLSTLSSATWSFTRGVADPGDPGVLTLYAAAAAWSPASLTWSNQPGPGAVLSSFTRTGAESGWTLGATTYYQAVLNGAQDYGLVLDEGPGCQPSDCWEGTCLSYACGFPHSQMWSAHGTHPPVVTFCP